MKLKGGFQLMEWGASRFRPTSQYSMDSRLICWRTFVHHRWGNLQSIPAAPAEPIQGFFAAAGKLERGIYQPRFCTLLPVLCLFFARPLLLDLP